MDAPKTNVLNGILAPETYEEGDSSGGFIYQNQDMASPIDFTGPFASNMTSFSNIQIVGNNHRIS